MTENNCYLCVSDEGVLLDIFRNTGKSIRENIETCLSVKVNRNNTHSSKICHKCAYELECCGKFLKKYKSPKTSKEKTLLKKGYCSLCDESEKNVHLLKVNEGKALNKCINKIEQVFNDGVFTEEISSLLICLNCRYNLDVLLDLKSIHRETLEKLNNVVKNKLGSLDLPKTQTRVVSRKTTQVIEPNLNGEHEYDSDSSDCYSTMSLKRRCKLRNTNKATNKAAVANTKMHFRNCEECGTQVESGIDMYRYHRTGLTVCRDCWLSMDPEKMVNGKQKGIRRADSESSTKLCAVYLKDVLSNPSKYKNVYKLEKDDHGNRTLMITDDSSENEDKAATRQLRTRATASKSPVSENSSEKKRGAKRQAAKKDESETTKRTKPSTRGSDKSSDSTSSKSHTKSEVEPESATKAKSTRGSETKATAGPVAQPEQKVAVRKRGRPAKLANKKKSSSEESLQIEESSSNEKPPARSCKRIKPLELVESLPKSSIAPRKLRARSNSFTENPEKRLKRTSSESSEVHTGEGKMKAPKKYSKVLKSDSELEKQYTCSVCLVSYKNALIGKSHELTHKKQPEVKLRRVIMPEIIIEKPLEESLADEPEKESEETNKVTEESPEDATPEKHDESTEEVPVAIEKPGSDEGATIEEEKNETSEDLEKEKSNECLKSDENALQKEKEEEEDNEVKKDKNTEESEENENNESEPKVVENTEEPSIITEEVNGKDVEAETQENVQSIDSKDCEEIEKTNNEMQMQKVQEDEQSTDKEPLKNVDDKNEEHSEPAPEIETREDQREELANNSDKAEEHTDEESEAETVINVNEKLEVSDFPEVNDTEKPAETTEEPISENEEDAEKQEKPETTVNDEETRIEAISDKEDDKEINDNEEKEEETKPEESNEDNEKDHPDENNETEENESEKNEVDDTLCNETEKIVQNIETHDINQTNDMNDMNEPIAEKDVNGCKEVESNEEQSDNLEVEKTDRIPNEDQLTSVTNEITPEIFDLANAEVKKRSEKTNFSRDEDASETVENISLEIQNSSDNQPCEVDECAVSTNST